MKRGNGGTDRDEGVEKGRGRGRWRVRKRRDDWGRDIIRETTCPVAWEAMTVTIRTVIGDAKVVTIRIVVGPSLRTVQTVCMHRILLLPRQVRGEREREGRIRGGDRAGSNSSSNNIISNSDSRERGGRARG